MPQWGMGKGLQNVVNSWVNVNNNTTNFSAKSNDGGSQAVHHHHHQQQHRQQSSNASSATHHQNIPQQNRQQGGRMGVSSEGKNLVGNNMRMFSDIDATYSTKGISTHTTSLGRGANLSPYLLYGSKRASSQVKNSGKLKRTNSQSDLLKERAARRNSTNNNVQKDPNVRRMNANEEFLLFGLSSMLNIANNNNNNERISHGTVNRGTHLEPIQSDTMRSQQQKIINTGQYINENAFANHHRSMQLAAQELENMAKLKKGMQLRNQTNSAPPPSVSSEVGSHHMPTAGRRQSLPEITKFPSTGPLQAASVSGVSSVAAASTTASGAKNEAVEIPNCDKCDELEKRIVALESDLEYMRNVALNTEYVCASCERRNVNNPTNSASSIASVRSVRSNVSKHSRASSRMLDTSLHSHKSFTRKPRLIDNHQKHDNLTLAQASRRLVDLTARHKRQIEHMSKEMGRWQHDMHLKLSKLAMMCKDLNDESAKRKEQADVAREDLDTIREERNALSSELEILRARIALYEKQEVENTEIRQLLRENQNETISMADQAITERDAIIEELTLQLQHFMEIHSNEKGKS
jgi:hypothetical protein